MSQPESVSEKTAPSATPKSASPRSPSDKPSFSCTSGMCGTQLATVAPLTKKMVKTAKRAASGREVMRSP